ncbi:MAG TPA: BMP family ABC transporter substrate-binding protein [Candidatus Dormibacteraeota bacterium]|nr:BMP family ABC transporter substrate-binding protein [Candidatus Dormibacteraeota bacterium]
MSRRAAVLMISLMLAACGGPNAAPDTARTHVCIATNSDGPAPHTFNQLAIDGARGTGAAVQVITSKTTTEYLSALQRCVAAKPELIIAVSIDMASAVWHAAQVNTKQKFALVDAMPVDDNSQEVTLSNVNGLLFNEQEPAYLVGAMAGLMEKEKIGNASHNVLGVLGSNHGPGVDPYIAGFVTGARDADPSVVFKIAYSDSQDTAFCKQLGITQISAGADLLFEVTGRCASGYIDAAYDASGYAIGSNNDQAFVSPAVITSALKRVDRAVALTIQRLQNGQFRPGKQVFSLQEDATGFSTPSSVVPQDIVNQVLDLRTKIRNGSITPPDVVPPGV